MSLLISLSQNENVKLDFNHIDNEFSFL